MGLEIRKFLPEDKAPYGKGAKDLYNVFITNGNWVIQGQMKSTFSLNLEAEWADLINGTIPGTELMKKLGNAELATGLFSQKYFSKGGYFNIPIEFRVLEDMSAPSNRDNKKTSRIVRDSRALSNMMVPRRTNLDSVDGIVNEASKYIDAARNTGQTVLQDGFKTAGEKIVTRVSNKVQAALANRTVTLQVGRFFKCHGMIIKSLKIDYSKEIIRDIGPMYADFSVGLESIQAAHQGSGTFGVDEVLTEYSSRVTITDSSKVSRNADPFKTSSQRKLENRNR